MFDWGVNELRVLRQGMRVGVVGVMLRGVLRGIWLGRRGLLILRMVKWQGISLVLRRLLLRQRRERVRRTLMVLVMCSVLDGSGEDVERVMRSRKAMLRDIGMRIGGIPEG